MALYLKYLSREMIDPLNYIIAFVIGIIINFFQGEGIFSSAIPFIIPVLVQAISKASAKYNNHEYELLVRLPIERTDPAFVIDRSGNVVAHMGQTRSYFKKYRIKNIKELIDVEPGFADSLQDISTSGEIFKTTAYSTPMDKPYKINIKADSHSQYLLVWMDEITS